MQTFTPSTVSFLSSFDFLFKRVFEHCPIPTWVAGGSLSSQLCGRPVNDFDIFSNDPIAVCDWVRSRYGAGDSTVRLFENDQVLNMHINNRKIQIIKNHSFASPQETCDAFDFTACCAAYDGEQLFVHDRFFLDNAQKRLVVNKLPFPLSTLSRSYKYVSYGYSLCPVGLNRIVKSIVELQIDFNNPQENQILFYPSGALKFTGID